MPGHIKLGAPGTLYDYMIVNTDLYSKTPANQFAAKLATGAGNYDDLQNWSYWVMDDWQAGVGKKDAEAGGFLYSEVESRYPNRLALPNSMFLTVAADASYPLNYGYQLGKDMQPNAELTLSPAGSVRRIAHGLNGRNATALNVTFWLDGTVKEWAVAVYSSTTSGGNQIPNAQIAVTTFFTDGEPGYHPYTASFSGTYTAGTYYHLVLYPTSASAVLPYNNTTVLAAKYFSVYDGSAWSNYTGGSFLHSVMFDEVDEGFTTALAQFNGKLYAGIGSKLMRKANDAGHWTLVSNIGYDITDLEVVGDELWIGIVLSQASATSLSEYYRVMDAAESVTESTVAAQLFYASNGYVYRVVDENVYYIGDGSTWEGPIQVAQEGHKVRGIASLGDYIYCSTDDGLYYIGFGDGVFPAMRWPSINSENGKGMINHQGSLYIPLQHSIVRWDGNTLMPVGLDNGEGLPEDRVGLVSSLYSLNNWLVAVIKPATDTDKPTIWAYNDQGWHYLGGLPYGMTPTGGITYDVTTRRLYVGTILNLVWALPIADSANFNYVTSLPMGKLGNAWIETDWFFGGLLEVQKDFDSVYLTGDNLSSTRYVKVYWKDDASTDWELLGTVTSDRTDLRWSDYSKRPNSRQLKLGLLLVSASSNVEDTPVVRAIRIKYHPMVSDWFRWSFPILVSDNQQEMGWTVSSRTAQQKRDHLDEMIIRVPPFIFEDMDEKQYEVKVMGCQIQNMDVEWINGEQVFNSIYNMTIEAIRSGEYGG